MNHLTADENACDFLRGVLEPVEIRDEKGTLLGVFTPHVTPEMLARYERAKARFDDEEIKRRKAEQQGKGAPFAEVIQRIQARGTPE